MRCLKLQWKISHRFVGIQFGSIHDINSSTLSFYIDPFQPAKQRWNQEYMYLQVCGPRGWRWPRNFGKFGLLDSLVPWHGSKIHHLQNFKRNAIITLNWFIVYPTRGEILEESIEFNWPSPRRLFLLTPRLPEGFWHCSTSDRYFRWSNWMCPNLFQMQWKSNEFSKMDLFSTNVEENPLQVWSPRWSAVTGLNSALIAMVSGLGMRFPDKDMYNEIDAGDIFCLFQSWTCRVGNLI